MNGQIRNRLHALPIFPSLLHIFAAGGSCNQNILQNKNCGKPVGFVCIRDTTDTLQWTQGCFFVEWGSEFPPWKHGSDELRWRLLPCVSVMLGNGKYCIASTYQRVCTVATISTSYCYLLLLLLLFLLLQLPCPLFMSNSPPQRCMRNKWHEDFE